MKKIFTLMWAVVCAALTIVSCTPDNGDTNGDNPAVKGITVTGAPEANLAAQGGEFTLNYTLENVSLTAQLNVTTEAAWLHVGEIGAETIAFTYDANNEAPGSEPREAVITFACEGVQTETVTVKQDSQAPAFTVEFTECTPNSAIALLKAANQEMDWLCIFATSSQIAAVGTPVEYVNDLYNQAKEMGLPYLGLLQQVYMGGGSMGKGDAPDPIMCQLPWSAEPGDKLFMFVLGYNVDADMNDWAYDNSTLATAPHYWEVPLLPSPVLTVATEQTVSAAAGELVLDVTLENAMEGAYIKASTEAAWVVPTYADGKLTLTYEANTAALSRQATISVEYVKKNVYGDGPDDWWEESITWADVTLTQEKDAAAKNVTFDIQVVETHFYGIIVNVTPSDNEAYYALDYVAAKDWDGQEVEINWLQQVSQTSLDEYKVFQGALTNHLIKTNINMYQWVGYDYHVYAFAVNEAKDAPAGEASHIKTTVDASDTPKLTLSGNGLEWNESNDQYEIKVSKAGTYTFNYEVENPVEGASLQLNGSQISDVNNLVENNDLPIFDHANKTVSVVLNGYPTGWNKSWAPTVSVYFSYTNAEQDTWGVQATIKFIFEEPTYVNETTLTAEEIYSISKPGSYYLADGTNQVVANEATWLKWTSVDGVAVEACRVLYNNYTDKTVYNGCFQFQGDASNVEKQGFLGNGVAYGDKEIESVTIEALSSYETPSFNLYYGDAKLPQDAAKVLAAADNCVKGDTVIGKDGNYDVYSFTCTFDIPAGHKFVAVRNDSKGATYIKNITIKFKN